VAECPRHASCLGGINTPIPEQGYWIDHSDYEYAGYLYRCSGPTCKGGRNGSECYTMTGFNKSYCVNRQCSGGSQGPLCGSCMNNYIRSPGSLTCEKCSETWTVLVGALGCIFLLLVFAIIFLSFAEFKSSREIISRLFRSIDSGTLKVIWVTYQIVVSASFTLDIEVSVQNFKFFFGFVCVFVYIFHRFCDYYCCCCLFIAITNSL
jgi:hypothetical protein